MSLPLALGLALLSPNFLRAADWPNYRGPTHDGVSAERINKNWTGPVTNAVWLAYLTNGLTSLTVSGGRVFTQVRRSVSGQSRDVCIALSSTNGQQLWATVVDNANYPNGGVGTTDDGARSTPVVDGGSVYVFTSYHKLYRLNATNGAIIWTTNLLAGFGGSVIDWQSAASPVLENGLLFVNANCGTGTLMAWNAATGSLVWRSQNEAMTHSTPVLATIHGIRHLIFATQSGLVAVNPLTGGLLWKIPHAFSYTTSVAASPAVHNDLIFLSAYYNMGAYAVQVVQSNTTLVPSLLWSDWEMQDHWATPVCYAGAVFASFLPDDETAELRCVDMRTGVTRWAQPGFGRGATLLVGTNLLVITELGELVLAEANTNAYVESGRFQAIPDTHPFNNKCWNALALSDGQLYVRSTASAARFDLSVPDVKFDPPQLTSASKLALSIRTVTGAPLDSDRLEGMEIRVSTNLGPPPNTWAKITNALILSNGIVRVTNVDASPTRRFFILSEPK